MAGLIDWFGRFHEFNLGNLQFCWWGHQKIYRAAIKRGVWCLDLGRFSIYWWYGRAEAKADIH